uniref:AAA+ ATPase domain-containing protein n=1 Tax=Zea mays TaxID=4577 RepID=A0A804PQJ8_MAIZE
MGHAYALGKQPCAIIRTGRGSGQPGTEHNAHVRPSSSCTSRGPPLRIRIFFQSKSSAAATKPSPIRTRPFRAISRAMSSSAPAPAAMAVDDAEDDQLASMSTEEITRASRLLDNEIRVHKDELQRSNLELESIKEKTKENQEKIKLNKQLPYLVGNIVEILEMNPEDEAEEDGANIDLDSQRKGKCVVLKTSTRQTIFLPVIGLVDPDKLKPGDLVGVNKDSYLILDTLPSEYDSRVKAMEVDEKPTEDYNDIGGLEKQIQELVEAIVLPMTHKDRFQKLGIRPPKGVLLYGPPGTGKTLMARACAAQTNATFLKLAGPQLVQLAKEKAPCIIFIDEIDAIGTKRFDSEVSGDREVQRTMLELLNQLDGFSSDERIKVIAATNRADILDPALMRSGRLDRKIEFPHPSEEARARILQIHSRKMNVNPDVNFEELARSTDDFNGAQLKAVCVEAGMLALRRDATEVTHEDFNEGIIQVQAKKKSSLNYYA